MSAMDGIARCSPSMMTVRTIDLGEALAEGLELIRREDGASEVCGMWVNQRLEGWKG
jgi:hypothetical protein